MGKHEDAVTLLARRRIEAAMRLGLYSRLARRDITRIRGRIAALGYSATVAGIRHCRQDLMDRQPDEEWKTIFLNDFYSISGCRDLLFHGLTGTPTEMKCVGKGLARAGLTVYAPQLAGHCGSKEDLLATGWRDWYASAEEGMVTRTARSSVMWPSGVCSSLSTTTVASVNPGSSRGERPSAVTA